MIFTDTHCHIHEESYVDAEAAYTRAVQAGVTRLICVGTDEKSSAEAVNFALKHENVWASVGLHPHDANSGTGAITDIIQLLEVQQGGSSGPSPSRNGFAPAQTLDADVSDKKDEQSFSKVVAVGECGLDYFYNYSPREKQIEMLHAQLELAQKYDLPVIFHVREAFDDFWPIYDHYKGLRGVLHSFTDNLSSLEQGLSRGLYVGVNGISTFATDKQEVYKAIPLDRLVLETDAPFLTPTPLRGTLNEPAFLTHIAHHLANLRSINLEELSRATERNATNIFFKHQ